MTPKELFDAHKDKALKIARKLARRLPDLDVDSAESSALAGLWAASSKFVEASGVRFMTFALPRIRGEIIDHLSRDLEMCRSRGKRVKRFDKRMTIDGHTPPVVGNVKITNSLSCQPAPCPDVQGEAACRRFLNGALGEVETEVVYRRVVRGETLRAIGAAVGLDMWQARYVFDVAASRLRDVRSPFDLI